MSAASRGANFPTPNVWQPRSRFVVGTACIVFGSFGVAMLIAGAVDAWHGDFLRALFLAAIGVVFVVLMLMIRLGRTVAGSDDLRYAVLQRRRRALRVNHATSIPVMMFTITVAAVVVGILFLIGIWTDWFELPLSSREQRRLGPPIVAVAVIMLYQLVLGIWRGWSAGLELSPTGVRVLTTHGRRDHAWESIAAITASDPASRKRSKPGIMFLRPHDRRAPSAVLDTGGLSIGSGAAYWLVKFYFEHPELRGELADDRAEARLRAEVAPTPR